MSHDIDLDDPALQDALEETNRLAALQSRSIPPLDPALTNYGEGVVVVRKSPLKIGSPTVPFTPIDPMLMDDALNLTSGELNFGGVETTLNDTERTAVMRIIVKACKRAITERAKGTKKESVA